MCRYTSKVCGKERGVHIEGSIKDSKDCTRVSLWVPNVILKDNEALRRDFEKVHNVKLKGSSVGRNGDVQVTMLGSLLGLFNGAPPKGFCSVLGIMPQSSEIGAGLGAGLGNLDKLSEDWARCQAENAKLRSGNAELLEK